MYRNGIAAQSIAAHVCIVQRARRCEVLGNFWPAASPSNFIVGPPPSADKGSLIRVLDPEIEAISHSCRHHGASQKNVSTNIFP